MEEDSNGRGMQARPERRKKRAAQRLGEEKSSIDDF
jgi:hypothetical protein